MVNRRLVKDGKVDWGAAIDRVFLIAGVGLMVDGVSRWSLPAALILLGALFIGGVLWRAR